MRPLSEAGREQARGLAEWLGQRTIESLACGSALKCRETLEPLAETLGLPIFVDDRLDQDANPADTIARVLELGRENAAICLNQATLQASLRSIVGARAIDVDARCDRAGAWMIDGDPPRAVYFAPRVTSRDRGAPVTTLESIPLSRGGKKMSNRQRVAVLDMGSTSFHLLVAEWTPDGELRRVARERVMLRMGSELARSSKISSSLLDRITEAVRSLCEFAAEHKAQQLVSVATAALREASNGPEVLHELEGIIGGPVHLLSGVEEARIVYRAIRSRIDLGQRTHIGLDLGGGSLEVVVGKGRKVFFEQTLPLGVARMQGLIEPSDPYSASDTKNLRQNVRQSLLPIVEEIQALKPVGCVAVGGTARALGRLMLREQGKPMDSLCGLRLDRAEVANLGKELCETTLEERLARPGISSRRADLLPFGAEILVSVLGLLGMSSVTICDWGLREGVLLDLLDSQEN